MVRKVKRQETLDREYALIEAAAIKGERCPQSKPFGPLHPAVPRQLAYAGRIRLEIFARNWRVATIMEGPHTGKHTQKPPDQGASSRPYKMIYRDSIDMSRVARDRQHARPAPVTLAKLTFTKGET